MNALAMIAACYEGQSKGMYIAKCAGCGDEFNESWASLADWSGICGLCAMKTELGMMTRPEVKIFWADFDA